MSNWNDGRQVLHLTWDPPVHEETEGEEDLDG